MVMVTAKAIDNLSLLRRQIMEYKNTYEGSEQASQEDIQASKDSDININIANKCLRENKIKETLRATTKSNGGTVSAEVKVVLENGIEIICGTERSQKGNLEKITDFFRYGLWTYLGY